MIRRAVYEDIPVIIPIFERARRFMERSGNPHQWIDDYPSETIIAHDIQGRNFYVEEFNGRLTGCFAFIVGEEPTYQNIEGRWPNELSYGTIHRLASSFEVTGVASRCFHFCGRLIPNLRADTHEDNKPMQHLLLTHGFRYCGRIRVANGSERLAYQLTPEVPVSPIILH